MIIQKSSEDYLEAMLMLQEEHGYIRSVDISHQLHVTKPSVSYAVKNLRENGYITMQADGMISLTDSGMEIAERIYSRHKLLNDVFIQIGVDEKTAAEDACKVEHALLHSQHCLVRLVRGDTSGMQYCSRMSLHIVFR